MDPLSLSVAKEASESDDEHSIPLPNHNTSIEPYPGSPERSSMLNPQLTYFDLRRLYMSTTFTDGVCDLTETFQRVKIVGPRPEIPEMQEALAMIREALQMRSLYTNDSFQHLETADAPGDPYEHFFDPKLPLKDNEVGFRMEKGVMKCWRNQKGKTVFYTARPANDFFTNLHRLMLIVTNGPCKTLSYRRLKLLESRYEIHMMLNSDLELQQQKAVPHRDFYNIRKIDNHIHHSACMNQKHLLRFIKKKLREFGDEIVTKRNGQELTLKQVFDTLNLNPYDLSVDALNMHAREAFHRFDKFNLKYNPIGETRLREIFLKTDNHIKGRYLAEVTKEVFSDLVSNKYQFAEYRLSIYGKKRNEWTKLSNWICSHKLSCKNVRWMIQIPRLYAAYKKSNLVSNFQEILDSKYYFICISYDRYIHSSF